MATQPSRTAGNEIVFAIRRAVEAQAELWDWLLHAEHLLGLECLDHLQNVVNAMAVHFDWGEDIPENVLLEEVERVRSAASRRQPPPAGPSASP